MLSKAWSFSDRALSVVFNGGGCCRTRGRRREMQGKKLFLDKEVTRFRLSER
ncbi:hypothetical protein ACVWYF_002425, partial [Hymenobacter sp. UYAg731]